MKKEQVGLSLQTSRALSLHIYEGGNLHFCLVFSKHNQTSTSFGVLFFGFFLTERIELGTNRFLQKFYLETNEYVYVSPCVELVC